MSVAVGLLATFLAGFANRLGTLLQSSQIVSAFVGPMLGCMVWTVSPAGRRGRKFRSDKFVNSNNQMERVHHVLVISN